MQFRWGYVTTSWWSADRWNRHLISNKMPWVFTLCLSLQFALLWIDLHMWWIYSYLVAHSGGFLKLFMTFMYIVYALPNSSACFKSALASAKCWQTNTAAHPNLSHQCLIHGCYCYWCMLQKQNQKTTWHNHVLLIDVRIFNLLKPDC